MELCLTGLTLKEEEIASTIGGDSYNNQQQQQEQFDIILQSRHRDFKSHINMSDKQQQHHQLKPKSTTAIKKKIRRPPSSIQVQLSNKLNDHVDPLDLSFSSSTEDYYHTMNSPGVDNNKRSRSWSPNSASKDEDDRIREEEWSKLLEKTPPLNRPLGDGEPYGGGSGGIEMNPQGVIDIANNMDNPFSAPPIVQSSTNPSPNNNKSKPPSQQPKSILRRRLSSKQQQLTSQEHQKRQQIEIQSILSTLEELQHNFVTNDNSDANSISNNTHKTTDTPPQQQSSGVKEYTTISYPNGNLFSGTVSSSSNNKSSSADPTKAELIYGRMTCALEMEVYEGPFKNGKRHGEGAVCTKLDGDAKFLGRYHEGQMHSGTLITKDFTYTGTFLNNDFHGIGTIISVNGSIYQGQLQYGQYHGVGMLRTVLLNEEDENVDRVVEEEDRGQDDKDSSPPDKKKTKKNLMESVYTGDFNEGLFHGHGSLTHSDGSSYVGTWHEGKRIEGTETLTNGDVFEGKFVNDVREGQGILKMKCGRVTKSGIWENDQLKEGEDLNITFGEGHVYCGDHVNSVPHGFGRMEYADLGSGESVYTGWFVNGFRQGEGRCFFHKTGTEYEGEWACDEPIGLKLFQHNGPLVIESSEESDQQDKEGEKEEDCPQEDDILVATIDCPPTRTRRRRSLTKSPANNEIASSFVSATSACSLAETVESMALSSIEHPESQDQVPSLRRSGQSSRLRISTTDSDNLSSSMKSLTVFDYSEQGLKLYKYQNGDIFKGHLDKNNLRQGSGVYTEHLMGTTYNGDWRDSKRHGVGHLQLSSGLEYSGEFFMDQIHGQGNLTLIDGSVYTGSFFNGLFHGRGMLEDDGHQRVYFGEFENGERSGEGEEKYPDGSRFKGEYKNGKRNGVGTLTGPDGVEIYTGGYNDDLKHGKGHLSRHKQENSSWEGSYDGDFFQDKFSGDGKFTYTDGTSIEGQWLDDVPRDGDWTIIYPDGSKFYGFATFQHPEDKSIGSNGSRLSAASSGEFLRVPLPHGFGSLTWPSGQRYVGSFVYGEYNDNRK